MEYRYMPPVAQLIGHVRDGTIGTLRTAMREHRFPFLPKVGDWNRFSRRTGGTLVEKCCHFFDLMRLIVQDEPVRVYASGAADVNHRDESYGGETPDIIDNAYAVVDFRSGAPCSTCACSPTAPIGRRRSRRWATRARSSASCRPRSASGPKPRIDIPRSSSAAREERSDPAAVDVDEQVLKAGEHHGATYFQHQRFRRAVLEGAPVEVTLEDGLKAVVIGLAAERSVRRSARSPSTG